MSIIHSALKKADTEKQKKIEPTPISLETVLETAERRPVPVEVPVRENVRLDLARPRFSRPVAVAVLVAVAAALAGFFMLRPFGTDSLPSKPAVQSAQSSAAPAAVAPESKPAFFMPGARDFRLTGVVFSNGKGSALINGKMVEAGDVIKGAQIVEVREKSVVLERYGRNFTVRME